jgi:hypothetical protein
VSRRTVVIRLHADQSHRDFAGLFMWTVTRLIETLRESPVPITITIEEDE